jgi:hypothetical protein
MTAVLLAIPSCKRDAIDGVNQAQRDTFLTFASAFPHLTYKFFLGDGTPTGEDESAVRRSLIGCADAIRGIDYTVKCDESERLQHTITYNSLQPDEVLLRVPDDYFHLVYKVRAIILWAVARGFTNIFKCDTDTYIDLERLMESGFREYEFTGGRAGSECVAGGGGYWLSRRSACHLIDAPITYWAEDGWVSSTLKGRGVSLHADPRYGNGPVKHNNDMISSHLGFKRGYESRMMYDAHRARYNWEF